MPRALPAQHADFIRLNAAFAALCAIAIAFGGALPIGLRLLALTALYNAAVVWVAWSRGYRVWKRMWFFAAVFGLANVVPDIYLTAAGLLVFPQDGAFRIVNIAGYMPLLWTLAMFVLLYISLWTARLPAPRPYLAGFARAWLASALVFAGAEHGFALIGAWHAADGIAYTLGNGAAYVLAAELMLMSAAYPVCAWTLHRAAWLRACAAVGLTLVYLGALFAAYILIETA